MSHPVADYLHELYLISGVSVPETSGYPAGLKCGAEDLFFHIVAVLHAPLYREENAGALRQDWPRVPLPKTAKVLKAGADLGRQIAALLDPDPPVEGVTTLKVRPDLKGLGELTVNEGSADTPVVFHVVAPFCIHLQSLAA